MRPNIHIENSYLIWNVYTMKNEIQEHCLYKYDTIAANKVLSRSYISMYIEWWLHNIGYYITKPFEIFSYQNLRCKDVDIQGRKAYV